MSGYYYLQDSRSYVGNDIAFWQLGGGYTCNILKAEVFTKESAINHHESRESDIPWPKDYIDAHTRPVVDMQCVLIREALKGTGIKLLKPKRPKKPRYRCGRFVSERVYYTHEYGCPMCYDD